jgi:hypothetical protein
MIYEKRWTRDKREYTFNSSVPFQFRMSDKDEVTLRPHRRWVVKTKKGGKPFYVYRTDGWVIDDPDARLRFSRYDQKFTLLHEAQLFVQQYARDIVKELGR